MSDRPSWLPDLVLLAECGGDWDAYLARLYSGFQADFLDGQQLSFQGVRMGLKKHPIIKGKEATFWHMIQEGSVEEDRTPDFRRCERIRWPRAIIDNQADPAVKVWCNSRNNRNRILLLLESERYLVVLADRGEYVLPWTAYLVERKRQLEKLLKEHSNYHSPP